MAIAASTRLAAVIGDPVRHSLSPVIHNAAFEACGIDGVYVALPVKPGDAASAIAAMRSFDWYGLSVTMPHKQAIAEVCDDLTESARALDAVNCVFWRDDKIVGDNTDGHGFIRGLHADLGVTVEGMNCVVVGAGGAAKAVVRSLAASEAAQVIVVNRNPDRAAAAALLAGDAGRVGTSADLEHADLVVNATPIGMADTDHATGTPLDVACLSDHAVVSDLIYHPAETPLLVATRERGLQSQNGLAMLVHQAVVQFEHWTRVEAPVEAMRAALSLALTSR